MAYGSLLFEFDAGVARITLNRPDAANALDLDLARELSDVALRCDEDRSVRAVVIGANGRFFCSGGDLASFRGAGDAMPAAIKELVLSSFVESLESQMEIEGRGIADAARTADAREGLEAFFAKRKPVFHGE